MRFAITLTDRYLGICEGLVASGWEPVKVFTTPVDQRIHQHRASIDYAMARRLPIQISPMTERDLEGLAALGCAVLVVASYAWRIGDWGRYLPYAINFHPSPLPLGRGPYPQVQAILGDYREWGVSCHRIDPGFDSGPVLATRRFPLAGDESHDSLDLRIQLAGRALAEDIGRNFQERWAHAEPQQEGSYFSWWTPQDRTLDFARPLAWNLRRLRAFGPLECLAALNGATLHVRRAVGWEERHGYDPGTVIRVSVMRLVVAVPDGFLALLDWSLHAADQPIGTPPS